MDDLLKDIVDESIEQKPEPSSFAGDLIKDQENDNANGENGEPIPPTSGTPSRAAPGFASTRLEEIFNPEIHAVGGDGQPRRNQDGSLRRKRGKRGVTVPPGEPLGPTGPTPGCREAAKVTVSTFIVLGQVTFGDEWKAMPEEVEMMVAAWTDYFMSQGVDSFPPWVGVAMAMGAYAGPRCVKPKTAGKLKTAWDWLKAKFKRQQ